MRYIILSTFLLSLGACGVARPDSIVSPSLDSGVRGNGGGGSGGEDVVGKSTGNAGVVKTTVYP